MTFAAKADKIFAQRLEDFLAPEGYVLDLGGDWASLGDDFEMPIRHWRAESFPFDQIEKLFTRYGTYLELVGMDDTVEETQTFYSIGYPRSLVKVGHGEPSVEEEQTALLDGTIHASGLAIGLAMDGVASYVDRFLATQNLHPITKQKED